MEKWTLGLAKVDGPIWKAGWYLPSDARPLGEGGGGLVYVCYAKDLVEMLREGGLGVPKIAAPDIKRPAATRRIDQLEQYLLNHTAKAVVKFSKKPEARTAREISAMKATQHPNLIKVFAHDQSDQAEPPRWMVLEYHPGGNLEVNAAKYLGQPLAVLQALIPVAEALGRLHQKDLIHRDVKPGNLFVAREGGVVLGDLGIVYDDNAPRLTEAADPPVSRDWVPPWGPVINFDARWDLYMLTRVAMFLIAGQKMKHNHWLKEPPFCLPARFPAIAGIDEVQDFFRRHFVDHAEGFPSKTVSEYVDELRDLVALLGGDRIPRLVWTFLAHSGQPMQGWGVSGVPILLGSPTRRLVARVTVNAPAQVKLELASVDTPEIFAESGVTTEGGLTQPFLVERRQGFPVGWYRLSLSVQGASGSSSAASLSSAAVYAE